MLVTATLLATGVFASPQIAAASEESTSDFVSSTEVELALDAAGDAVVTPFAHTLDDRLSSAQRQVASAALSVEVEIPQRAEENIDFTVGEFSMEISLPHSEAAQTAETLEGGEVVYPSAGNSANAVIPTEGGVQFLSILANENAAERYSYEMELPDGHQLQASEGGGAEIIDASGVAQIIFQPAWARDAQSRSVPSHYETDGTTLTQIVQHKGLDDVSYPIVADPLPIAVIVITAAALIVVAAAALGVATWLVVSWWNTCRAMNKYPQLSTHNGFTARCVR